MKKTKTDLRIPRKLIISLAVYSVFIAWLFQAAIQNYNRIDYEDGRTIAPSGHDAFMIFLFFLCAYIVRCLILFLPNLIARWKNKLYTQHWLKAGIIFSLLPELYLINELFNATQLGSCGSGANYACGWSSFAFAFIFLISCGLQIVGMISGTTYDFIKRRKK
jgi:hypothetical protein